MTRHLTNSEYWQNFELGKEVEIASGFIYDGLRNLHEMESLYYESEIFSVLYGLSVGIERFMKIALILIEVSEDTDLDEYEKSLITHSHLDLLGRIKKFSDPHLGPVHNELLGLLGTFYKTYRYDRYSVNTVEELAKEKQALLSWLSKHLGIDVSEEPPFKVVRNDSRIQRFVGRAVGKIVGVLYGIIRDSAGSKGIYTYEVRNYSKAYKLLLGNEFDFHLEDVLWKELLIFLLATDEESPWLDYIGNLEPLDFDPALIPEYLQCFQNLVKRIEIADELETLYEDIDNKGDRLKSVEILGDPNVHMD